MNRNNLARLACLQLAIATVAFSGSATAATRAIGNIANAAAICQSALPAFDGLIRKRPLAIQNEGSSDAFVTCPMVLAYASSGNATAATVYVRSNDGVAHQVSCTGVSGYATGTNQAVVKTVTVAASGTQSSISWTPGEFTGSTTNFPSALFSLSCVLPPGTGLNDTYYYSTIDVGT